MQGGADMRGGAYLGSDTLRASKHAVGTFRLRAALCADRKPLSEVSTLAGPWPAGQGRDGQVIRAEHT